MLWQLNGGRWSSGQRRPGRSVKYSSPIAKQARQGEVDGKFSGARVSTTRAKLGGGMGGNAKQLHLHPPKKGHCTSILCARGPQRGRIDWLLAHGADSCLECLACCPERCGRCGLCVAAHGAGSLGRRPQTRPNQAAVKPRVSTTAGARSRLTTTHPARVPVGVVVQPCIFHCVYIIVARGVDMHDPYCRPREALRSLLQKNLAPSSQHAASRRGRLQSAEGVSISTESMRGSTCCSASRSLTRSGNCTLYTPTQDDHPRHKQKN